MVKMIESAACPGGGIGRHEGLKIPCLSNGVRVQFPPRAPKGIAGTCFRLFLLVEGIEKVSQIFWEYLDQNIDNLH